MKMLYKFLFLIGFICCCCVLCQTCSWNLSVVQLGQATAYSSYAVTMSGTQIFMTSKRFASSIVGNVAFYKALDQENLIYNYMPVPINADWGAHVKVVNTGDGPSNNTIAGLLVCLLSFAIFS